MRPINNQVNYRVPKCKPKRLAQSVAYYWANHKKQLEYKKEYYRKNRDRILSNWKKKYGPRFYARNPDYEHMNYEKKRARLLTELFKHYGKICSCCGENNIKFLSVDHIKNDGKAHRAKFGTGMRMFYAMKREGWPRDRYQLLCMNCNWGRSRNGNICPHKELIKQEVT